MNPSDFEFISTLLKKRSGLVLTPDKSYLLESRLMPVARKYGMKGLEELFQAVRVAPEGPLLVDVTEAMTTNESFFFRDTKPFDLFRDHVLPPLPTSTSVSSTACSARIPRARSSSTRPPISRPPTGISSSRPCATACSGPRFARCPPLPRSARTPRHR